MHRGTLEGRQTLDKKMLMAEWSQLNYYKIRTFIKIFNVGRKIHRSWVNLPLLLLWMSTTGWKRRLKHKVSIRSVPFRLFVQAADLSALCWVRSRPLRRCSCRLLWTSPWGLCSEPWCRPGGWSESRCERILRIAAHISVVVLQIGLGLQNTF